MLIASLAETFTAAQGLLHGDEGAVDLDPLLSGTVRTNDQLDPQCR